jgi:hypothetical protein
LVGIDAKLFHNNLFDSLFYRFFSHRCAPLFTSSFVSMPDVANSVKP